MAIGDCSQGSRQPERRFLSADDEGPSCPEDTRRIELRGAIKIRFLTPFPDAASEIRDMRFPGSDLHPLKGYFRGFWSVRVSGNWRIVFRFENGDVFDVDYIDYH